MYKTRASDSTDDEPWIVSEYYSYTLSKMLYIGITFTALALLTFIIGLGAGIKGYLMMLTI